MKDKNFDSRFNTKKEVKAQSGLQTAPALKDKTVGSLEEKQDNKKSADELVDDNFDFIKFLNEVRKRYDLSPTPLIEESPTKNSTLAKTSSVIEHSSFVELNSLIRDISTQGTQGVEKMTANIDHEGESIVVSDSAPDRADERTNRLASADANLFDRSSIDESPIERRDVENRLKHRKQISHDALVEVCHPPFKS